MEKEIKFEIKVKSEKDFERINELVKIYLANLELTGILKINSSKSMLYPSFFLFDMYFEK